MDTDASIPTSAIISALDTSVLQLLGVPVADRADPDRG
jgi:hypothetical protein